MNKSGFVVLAQNLMNGLASKLNLLISRRGEIW